MCNEHRDTGAIFGMIENLRGLIARRVKIDLRLLENCQLLIAKIIAIVRIREKKRSKRKEHFSIILSAGEATDPAESMQWNFTDKISVEVINFKLVVNIVHIGDNEVIINEGNIIDYVFVLRQDCMPVAWRGIIYIDSNDTSTRGVEVGIKVKDRVNITNEVIAGVGIIEQSYKWTAAFNGTIINTVLRIGAMVYIENEYNLYHGDDVKPRRIINFLDFAIFADSWLRSSYDQGN